ncbi:hypothetical protein Tsubulata_001217 [Turnera subulata]|uniref:Cupin type-1 domain-containing protein n=1 Tax=Turnera subulata TaxID=218843 RepID=A0A9Q0J293_9ROSI|nr:hypothetical protein Tsubulata_001217 [Turnera subulata]
MAYSSYISLTLCIVLLFHGCVNAQIEQVTSRQSESRRQRELRSQQNQCQLERINALEPSRTFQSEAGNTEVWDENDEQFQCAGVAIMRHTIEQRGLLLPHYANAPKLIYVEQGTALHGAAIPGCPETYQSSGSQVAGERGERGSSRDQHQKVRQIREGDVLALPAGVADWFYNNGESRLVLVVLLDTGNSANQLDQDFRKFFLAGNPQGELQSLRGQYQRGELRGRSTSTRGQQQRYRSVLSGFDERILAEAFNIDTQLASRLRNEEDRRGIIVRVQREFQMVSPHYAGQEQEAREREEYEMERGSRGGRYANGFEETFCSARLKHNLNDPSRADVFNPNAGRLTSVNSYNLPILRFIQLSAQKGVLYRNAMMTPSWNMNAHSICYITRGSGRCQIVSDNGQTVFDGQVRRGQVITAPQNFAVVKRAGSEGLEWISFKTNDNAQISQLAGRVSAIRAIPEEVLSNAFQISREEARRIKFNREEVTLFSSSGSRYERDD